MNGWSDQGLWLAAVAAGAVLTVSAASLGWIISRRNHRAPSSGPSYQLELLDSLYNNSPIAFAVIDRQGRFIDINRDPSDLVGYTKEEMTGKSFATMVGDEFGELTRQIFQRTVTGEKCSQEIKIVHKQGHTIDLNIHTSPLVRRKKTIGILVFIQDISDRKRSLERIRYMAYYDDMTGLPNRRFFTNRLEEKIKAGNVNGTRLAVCYLDVDHFKLINASFGRDFGDMLLLQIAERLSRGVSEPGDLARMEGDEFAACLDFLKDEEDVKTRLDAMLAVLEEPFELSGIPIHITVSIGVAVCEQSTDDAATLLKRADTALHRVKENGKNDYLLHSGDMDHVALHKLTIQHEMRRALLNQEFALFYQPQYDLASGQIVGMEALIRWFHPERGLVPPGDFIPAAEESGIIVPLGDWVIEEACRQNKEWQNQGMPFIPVSVNLSMRQFSQRNLTGKVSDILEQTGLDPRYLELEITESMTMDVDRASQCLKELTDLGVNISIDDFGTGYSSFHYLKNLPIARLKIDRSFVRDIQQDPNDAAIVAAIIAMAHNLQLQVIAEGVETEDQVHFLRSHRCDEMQGYFGSPPLPSDGVLALLREKLNRPALPVHSYIRASGDS
ncbi:putative bifunctional diguanylate cyclase/phosphodiesterase [Cohnella lupini]|uniref:PAS domain S-box-containing protein/diguanylate cyclase (GGDEF)-like protein n=1 Tax=Cohnella lupini TaxID=1294267 RepID=A0A3D9IQK1_9BACL|nr:GGDEF domain-containing phosphodiesterase [Cohnella lupini]RED64015.1 PAS domain S-box-containing protein/diguanylate cyclase (GGDEF)-like protein [Cohnella lupini]